MIAEWREILTSVLDRRRGSYFSRSLWQRCWDVTAQLCPAGFAFLACRMTGRVTTAFYRLWAARQEMSPNNCCMLLSGRFSAVVSVTASLWMTRRRNCMATKIQLVGVPHNPHPGLLEFRIPVRLCLGDQQLPRGVSAVGLHWDACAGIDVCSQE